MGGLKTARIYAHFYEPSARDFYSYSRYYFLIMNNDKISKMKNYNYNYLALHYCFYIFKIPDGLHLFILYVYYYYLKL